MPFDLQRAAPSLRAAHGDRASQRAGLLDLLFATGAAVGEQAVALERGDALCLTVQGQVPATGVAPQVVVTLDLDPPFGPGLGTPAWPASAASLGGPDLALAWLAAVHVLAASPRPWLALYVRGPAQGTAAYASALLSGLPAGARLVQLAPALAAEAEAAPEARALVELCLRRPRNVWRFPACAHCYRIEASLEARDLLLVLRELGGTLGEGVPWTLHELRAWNTDRGARASAVLRTGQPLVCRRRGWLINEVSEPSRLLYPVNDAMLAVEQLVRHGRPAGDLLGAQVLPEGLRLWSLARGAEEDLRAELPDHAGSLAALWRIEAFASPMSAFRLAGPGQAGAGPLPALDPTPEVWLLPAHIADADVTGLAEALRERLAA